MFRKYDACKVPFGYWRAWTGRITSSQGNIEEKEKVVYKGYKQLRPITIAELIKAGAEKKDVIFFESNYHIYSTLPLRLVIGYAFNTCKEKLDWLVDNTKWRITGGSHSRFIEKVEFEQEIKIGDKYYIDGTLHILINKGPISKELYLISFDSGRRKTFYSIEDKWNREIYPTRIPVGTKLGIMTPDGYTRFKGDFRSDSTT